MENENNINNNRPTDNTPNNTSTRNTGTSQNNAPSDEFINFVTETFFTVAAPRMNQIEQISMMAWILKLMDQRDVAFTTNNQQINNIISNTNITTSDNLNETNLTSTHSDNVDTIGDHNDHLEI